MPSPEKISEYRSGCIAQTKVDPERANQLRTGGFVDDDLKLKQYAACILKKLGIQNEDGSINHDILKKILVGNEKEVQDLVEKCLITKPTPEETAYESYKCVYQNSPKNRQKN